MQIFKKIGAVIGSIISEFITGFLPEYLLTAIAGTVFMLYYEAAGSFKEFGGGFWAVFVIDAILMAIGIRLTLLNDQHDNKIIAIIDHVLTFVILGFVGGIILAALAVIAVVLVLVIWFKGMDSVTSFFSGFTSGTSAPEPKEKVEVWRENGMMRENLKVNSSQDMYYDPEDGEWHKIEK